jgi:hypothetical protein
MGVGIINLPRNFYCYETMEEVYNPHKVVGPVKKKDISGHLLQQIVWPFS